MKAQGNESKHPDRAAQPPDMWLEELTWQSCLSALSNKWFIQSLYLPGVTTTMWHEKQLAEHELYHLPGGWVELVSFSLCCRKYA